MRSLIFVAVLLPSCAAVPLATSELAAPAESTAISGLRPSSPVERRRDRPRHYVDLMLGGSYWDGLGDLDPTGVGPVPGRFDDFDRGGFTFDFGYDGVVERSGRSDWTLGLELGFMSFQNDGTGLTTPISDISADVFYVAPTTRVMFHLSPRVTISPGFGAGYYSLRIVETETYYYGWWWHDTDSRTLNQDGTFGAFASLALDFNVSPQTAIRLESKAHFVEFEGLESLYPGETRVDGPIWTFEAGLVFRF